MAGAPSPYGERRFGDYATALRRAEDYARRARDEGEYMEARALYSQGPTEVSRSPARGSMLAGVLTPAAERAGGMLGGAVGGLLGRGARSLLGGSPPAAPSWSAGLGTGESWKTGFSMSGNLLK